jgi:hypothetical protein
LLVGFNFPAALTPIRASHRGESSNLINAIGLEQALSANYGKIYGAFMNFTYYLNPTRNDRNVQFDPKRNLFTNLKDDERVTAPLN